MIYIGIDPGVSGGIAAIVDGGHVLGWFKMPATVADTVAVLRAILLHANVEGHPRAVLEKVGPGLIAGKAGRMGVVSAFTFGRGVGHLEASLAALEIPYDEVTAPVWQAAMQCRSKGDKKITKRRAQQLFPHEAITHAIADALLLAEYARRFHTGMIRPKGRADGKAESSTGKGPDGRAETRRDARAQGGQTIQTIALDLSSYLESQDARATRRSTAPRARGHQGPDALPARVGRRGRAPRAE